MNKKIVFNGKFLTQQITGVQRYATEMITEFDKLIPKGAAELAVPPNVNNCPELRNIKIVHIGITSGNLWEQTSFPLYLIKKRAVGVNLCNVAPLIKPDIVCIHDVNFLANPDFFDIKFRRWYRLQFKNTCKNAKIILTDSEFSKSEILKYGKIKKDKVKKIYCSWQHFEHIQADLTIFERYPSLTKGNYYFSLMSINKNKNLKWILKAAENNPDTIFAVAGGGNLKVFGQQIDLENLSNVIYLGRVRDEEAKALMSECKAFIFPTFYEGFGLPPLEAMSTGASVIVSNSECMREIYGNSAYFIDPYNYKVDLNEILREKAEGSLETLKQYSWAKSASELLNLMNEIGD